MTAGFRLPARHVIHAVGPVWSGGGRGEVELLASCYSRSLELAGDAALASIAFPCISTGIFGFPRDRAARIAFDTIVREGPRHATLGRVVFCCYSESDAAIYRGLLGKVDTA
jgi:O-acetyl-ADP-ribose deacetylase (regulator of RNase III)